MHLLLLKKEMKAKENTDIIDPATIIQTDGNMLRAKEIINQEIMFLLKEIHQRTMHPQEEVVHQKATARRSVLIHHRREATILHHITVEEAGHQVLAEEAGLRVEAEAQAEVEDRS